MAEEKTKPLFVSNLGGGINATTSPLMMKDSECEIIQNYHLDNLGSLTKRNGIDHIYSTGTTKIGQIVDGKSILNMYFNKQTPFPSNENLLVAINVANDATSTLQKITSNAWGNSQTGNTASAIPHFATLTSAVYRVNGSDVMSTSVNLSSWSTTEANGNLQTKKPKYIANYEDRIYALNDALTESIFGSRIYWSSLPPVDGSYVTWTPTTDYADINPDDGDQITWGETYGDVFFIFKENSMYRWNFEQTDSNRVPGSQGTPQGLTVKQTQGLCLWANKYGVWALNSPYGMPSLVSQKVNSFIKAIPTLANMRAEVDNDHYYLYIGTVTVGNDTYTNCMLVYTISKNAWHIETYPFAIKSMARFERKTLGTTEIYDDIYMGDDDGFIYRKGNGTTDYLGADAKTISGKIQTKEYPLINFPEKYQLNKLWFLSQQGAGAKVNYRLNRKDWKPWKDLSERINDGSISGKGETIQFSITDNSSTISKIEGFVLT